MGKLTERYVQKASVEFLKRHYQNKYKLEQIFADIEVGVNYKNKRGRADGLIAFKNRGITYTASVEAKSHKTYKSLIPDYQMRKWYVFLSVVYIILATLLYIGLNNYNLIWVLPVVLILPLICVFAIYILSFAFGFGYKQGIIEQVRRYPANEQWLVIPIDVYNSGDHVDLFARASHYGIGIIVVSRKNKCEIVLDIKVNEKKKNKDYLFYYSREKSILDQI